MKRLLREPLFHFLAVGSILFILLSWFAVDHRSEPAVDSRRLVVEREDLLAFMSSRMKIRDDSDSLAAFETLAPEARQEWADRYVREEVLVREARALGLDRQDELIRRRLAQKIEFLTLGLLEEELRIDRAELENRYRLRGVDYQVPLTLTFTHVFVRNAPGARAEAETLLVTLDQNRVSFGDALGLGERFLYNRNYVDRTIDEVRSHFGDAFVRLLETLPPDDSVWRGPLESQHGWHLILFTRRSEARIPPLSEIAPLLREDALREKRETALDKAIAALVSKYQVELNVDVD